MLEKIAAIFTSKILWLWLWRWLRPRWTPGSPSRTTADRILRRTRPRSGGAAEGFQGARSERWPPSVSRTRRRWRTFQLGWWNIRRHLKTDFGGLTQSCTGWLTDPGRWRQCCCPMTSWPTFSASLERLLVRSVTKKTVLNHSDDDRLSTDRAKRDIRQIKEGSQFPAQFSRPLYPTFIASLSPSLPLYLFFSPWLFLSHAQGTLFSFLRCLSNFFCSNICSLYFSNTGFILHHFLTFSLPLAFAVSVLCL